jgi:drug/metabolite transporter (DMT)-like permease
MPQIEMPAFGGHLYSLADREPSSLINSVYLWIPDRSAQFVHICTVTTNRRTLAYLSYAYIAIIWGTTYLGIKIAVTHIPAFLMAGVRQVVSAFIMCGVAYAINRKVDLKGKTIWQNAAIGLLMITIGNGIVSWAENYVPSGVAALICSTMPISVVCINLLIGKSEKLNLLIVLGMLLGFFGVAMIFRQDLSKLGDPSYLAGIISLVFATFGWAAGSILSKRWGSDKNPMFDSGMQLFFGGLFLLITSPLVDNYEMADWNNKDALLALAYLIVFGSIFAFTLYRFALKVLPVGFVTSYAYINPLVAVFLGTMAGEALNEWVVFAFVAIIGGVFLVNTGYQQRRKKQEVEIAELT